jgi:sensor domain CHASE-containing protein
MHEKDLSTLMLIYFCMHLIEWLASLLLFFQNILFSSFQALHVSPVVQYERCDA